MGLLLRLLVLSGGLFGLLHLLFRPRESQPPFMIGHRGAAGLAPENTLAALKAGIAHGAKFVEVDVQRSSDGVLVVFHDDTLERTTNGHGLLREKTAAELVALDAGSWFGSNFAGERIPTLDEALQVTRAHGVTLVIEAKSPAEYPGIDRQLAQWIKTHDAAGEVIVISFDHVWLRGFKQLMPDVPVGYVWINREDEPSDSLRGEVSDVYWWRPLLDPALVWRTRRQGFEMWVWTVDHVWAMRLLVWLGVRGITTNRPDLWPF